MMRILVSTRIVETTSYPERRDALSHDWGRFFDRFRLLPILVPNSLAEPRGYMELGAKGLLLTGGDNLGSKDAPSDRDRTESILIRAAIDANLPILGVCRGLQMLNRYFGGNVLRSEDGQHVGLHTVKLNDGRILNVNSFHNDVVTSETLADELIPFAKADDGVIEGLTHPSLPITAIQWHPERANSSVTYDQFLVEQWMAKCA